MNIMNWIWFRLGKRHWNKRDLERALYYMRKGERAITDMSDHMIYAELLHNDGHSEEALTYLGQVARTAPDHRVHERRAYILRELGRDHDAIEDLNEAIRLNDDHYLTWFTRGITHKDLQQYDKAIADLKESMRREQQDTVISTYYELGMAYYESGNPKEAVIYFSKSVELPDRAIPIYYYMLAACLDLLDRLPDAVRALQAGIRLLTRYQEEEDGGYALFARSTNYSYEAFLIFQQQVRDSCDFRRVLADLYFRLGQYHDAERSIEEGLARFPDAHELYLKRAELRHHSGHKEEAKADLKQAIERSPDDYRAYFELARIYREDGLEKDAFELISSLYKRLPESPLVCYWMADALYRADRNDEALALSGKLLSLEPDDAPNHVQRADIYMELGDLASAEKSLKTAIAIQDGPEIRNKLSYVLYLEGRNEDALLELQEAVKQDAGFAEQLTYLAASGHIYKEMGMWDMAVDAYSQAIELNPAHSRFYEFRAICYMETGQLERAIADCTHGLQLNPQSSSLYILRSGCYYSLADYASAKEDIMLALELSPDHPGAYFRLGQICNKDQDENAALAAFDEVLRLVPGHADSHLYKAHIYYSQFELEDAVSAIANWGIHLHKEMPAADRMQAIEGLEGFEESLLQQAVERLMNMYGHQLYLS